jgi:hypothetical protein
MAGGMIVPGEGKGRKVRSAWRVVGAFTAVVLVGLGALNAAGAIARKTERTHRAFPDTVRAVDIRSSGGNVSVVGGEGPETVVDAVVEFGLQRPGHSEEVQGDRLVVRGGSCGVFAGPYCSVDFTIRVPRGIRVAAGSEGGDIAVSDVHGDVDLSSSGGDVELGGATTQKVRVRSSGGDVTARGLVGGSIDAASSGGDVTLLFAAPPSQIVANSSGGSVVIKVPGTADAYRVQASSSGGDVTTRIRTDPESSRVIRASSSGGDVSIRYGD